MLNSRHSFLVSAFVLLGGAALLAPSQAEAGEFKTLNTAGLGVGGQVTAYSSPKNNGPAMEMEVFEWASSLSGGSYRCRITQNATARVLNIRLIGINGTIVNSCTTSAGGVCDAPTVSVVSNAKFMCIVATQNGTTIPSDSSWYQMAVQRQG